LEQSAGKEKETAFFSHALGVIQKSPVKLLKIADYNTTGARGPSIKGQPFHTLLKASGVSVKGFDSSGGSFGIGKNAVFAVSELQTVFYSTVYQDDQGKPKYLAQGKSILISHTDECGDPRRQTGYWGHHDFQPITDQKLVPSWLQREDLGTSVCVLGFRTEADWAHQVAYSLLINFFAAIHAGEMEFVLDNGRFHITKLTLASWFKDAGILDFVRMNDRLQEFELAQSLFECLTSPNAHQAITELPALGQVQIRVLVREGLPKKVLLIRNGMIITDNLAQFGEKFVHFPMYRDFVCLVVPLDKEGSTFIKRLEDPQHKDLSAADLPDAASRDHAGSVMKRLGREIRKTIKQHTLSKFEGELAADEMRRYFAAPSETSPDAQKSKELDPERLSYDLEKQKRPHRPHATNIGEGDVGGGPGDDAPGPGPNPKPKPSPPNPNPKPPPDIRRGGDQVRPVDLTDLRNVRPANANARHRTIYFTPHEGGKAVIRLQATGLNASEILPVDAVDGIKVSNNKIIRTIGAGDRIKLNIEFSDEYAGPIDVLVGIDDADGEDKHEAQ